VKSVRPGCGLPTRFTDVILGKTATHDIAFAEPLKLEDIRWMS
jgi:sialic acid synthase SpsE